MTRSPWAMLWLAAQLLAYNLILLALLPAAACLLAWRAVFSRKRAGSLSHRLGLVRPLPAAARPRIWLHAVSAGEMAAARPVLAELRRRFPKAGIAVSTHTDTGMAVAEAGCKEADVLFYFPFDWPNTMGLALWRVRPQLVVVVEKELWPNFLALAKLGGAKVLAANGRVSDRMVMRERWLPGFVPWLYRLPDRLCVQSAQDAERLRSICPGAGQRIVLAGNTKADMVADRDREAEARLAADMRALDSEAWLVAGSTHPGEEEQVMEAFRAIREHKPRARLLLAPRHLERVAQVSAMVAERGFRVARRSEGPSDHPDAVVILDTMGELRAAYAFATAGLVGGTLVPIGGHNLLEPAAVGVASLFGPHTNNCVDTAELVLTAGIGFRVAGADELAQQFLLLAGNDALRGAIADRARELMVQQRGASARCVDVASELLTSGASK